MAIPGDSRFGQWADPNFGATLSHSSRATSPVLPAPAEEDQHQSASDNSQQSYGDYQSGFQASPTTLGSKGFSLGTRAWGENEIDPMTGNLGWKESYKDQTANTIMGYAEGGEVDDMDQDSGNAAPSPADPFALISSALSYGRQKYQMPKKLYGEPADPVTGYAEGGEVEDDQDEGMIPSPGQDQQPQGQLNPQTAMAYLKGDGAAPPDVAAALEQQVDPHNAMDPTERRMKAVTAAGTPDRAFSLLQHYRQKFNAYSAFADTALRGAGGRPPNVEAAADALNKAYSYVPDGTSVQFRPHAGGMHITTRKTIPAKPAGPGGDQPDQNPFPTKDGGFGKRTAQADEETQEFAEGGEVEEDDNSMIDPAVRAYQSGDQQNTGVLPEYDPSQDPMGAGETVPLEQEEAVGGAGEAVRKVAQPVGRAVADAAGAAGQQVADQVSRTPGAVKEYFVKLGNLFGIGTKAGFDANLDKGGFDAAAIEHLTPTDLGPNMEQGVSARPMDNAGKGPYEDGAPQSPAAIGRDIAQKALNGDVDLDDRKSVMRAMLKAIDQRFQSVGDYAKNQEAKAAAYQFYLKEIAGIEKEGVKGEAKLAATDAVVQGRGEVAKLGSDTKKEVTHIQQDAGTGRAHEKNMTNAQIAAQKAATQVSEGEKNRETRIKGKLIEQVPGVTKDAEKFQKSMQNVGQGQQAAPQQVQPQVTNRQPAEADILYLRAHPDMAARFDTKFGAGASQRVLSGQ